MPSKAKPTSTRRKIATDKKKSVNSVKVKTTRGEVPKKSNKNLSKTPSKTKVSLSKPLATKIGKSVLTKKTTITAPLKKELSNKKPSQRDDIKIDILKKNKNEIVKNKIKLNETVKKDSVKKASPIKKNSIRKALTPPINILTNEATEAKVKQTATVSSPRAGQTLLSYGVQPYQPIEGESYMSDSQLSHFRKILNIWKNALLQGGDETIHDLKESGEIPADISDQATQEETFALRLRTRDRESKLLKKIEEAIELINAKNYGYCVECGEEIGIRRLEARPTATLCIDCKTLDEVRERQRG